MRRSHLGSWHHRLCDNLFDFAWATPSDFSSSSLRLRAASQEGEYLCVTLEGDVRLTESHLLLRRRSISDNSEVAFLLGAVAGAKHLALQLRCGRCLEGRDVLFPHQKDFTCASHAVWMGQHLLDTNWLQVAFAVTRDPQKTSKLFVLGSQSLWAATLVRRTPLLSAKHLKPVTHGHLHRQTFGWQLKSSRSDELQVVGPVVSPSGHLSTRLSLVASTSRSSLSAPSLKPNKLFCRRKVPAQLRDFGSLSVQKPALSCRRRLKSLCRPQCSHRPPGARSPPALGPSSSDWLTPRDQNRSGYPVVSSGCSSDPSCSC